MRQREDLSRVCEWHRAFTWRVEGAEQIHKEGNQAEMGCVILGNVVGHTRCEQSPEHVRERKEQESTAAESIDGPDGGPGKNEVDKTKTEGSDQGIPRTEPTLPENGRRVKGNDVN